LAPTPPSADLAPASQPHLISHVEVAHEPDFASSSTCTLLPRFIPVFILHFICRTHLSFQPSLPPDVFQTSLSLHYYKLTTWVFTPLSPAHLLITMTRNPPTKRGSPGKGQNKWTHEQRVCLDILFHHPDSPSSNERARAFNAIFKDHQAACGVIGGLAYKVLAIQYKESDYKHKSTWAKTWGPVRAVPRQDTDLRERLRDMIDQVLMSGDTIQVSAGPATPPTTPPGRSETTMASSGDDTGSRPVALPQRYRGSQLATPGPSTRKHPASTSEITLVVDEDEEDDDYQPGPKRARNARSPVVELPATPPESVALIRLHASASKKSAKSPQKSRVVGRGRPGADRPFLRPDGVTIMLKPKEYLETQQPLNIVSEEAAHPKTGPALVFRYWDEQSHGL
jgi:hypothetical protein